MDLVEDVGEASRGHLELDRGDLGGRPVLVGAPHEESLVALEPAVSGEYVRGEVRPDDVPHVGDGVGVGEGAADQDALLVPFDGAVFVVGLLLKSPALAVLELLLRRLVDGDAQRVQGRPGDLSLYLRWDVEDLFFSLEWFL